MNDETRKEIWKEFDKDFWSNDEHVGKYGDFLIDLTEKAVMEKRDAEKSKVRK